uniref:Uncharacterized protein n=1 Tax=Anguilla anguilla TaxID=7936 RepID=A0A0E9WF59_ANGAN
MKERDDEEYYKYEITLLKVSWGGVGVCSCVMKGYRLAMKEIVRFEG